MLAFTATSAALVLAAPAQAGTIELAQSRADFWYAFTAAPGERNDLLVEAVGGKTRVTDRAGRPQAAFCVPEGEHAVLCPERLAVVVHAGDGDDTVVGGSSLYGGPGNDHLTTRRGGHANGGPGDDLLEGGDFAESLAGGAGRDRIAAGGGNDEIHAGDDDADRIDGGPGRDRVLYRDADGVRVDLPRGRASDGDALTGVEDVFGSPGRDVLLGDGRPNRLEGGQGDDRVEGRGGRDWIITFHGHDRIDGGAGDDAVELYASSDVRCGAGADRVQAAGRATALHADCERIAAAGPVLRQRRDGSVTVDWDTRRFDKPCTFGITIGGRALRRGETVRVQRPAVARFEPRGRCDRRSTDSSRSPSRAARFRLL